jgi:hypothetical protein
MEGGKAGGERREGKEGREWREEKGGRGKEGGEGGGERMGVTGVRSVRWWRVVCPHAFTLAARKQEPVAGRAGRQPAGHSEQRMRACPGPTTPPRAFQPASARMRFFRDPRSALNSSSSVFLIIFSAGGKQQREEWREEGRRQGVGLREGLCWRQQPSFSHSSRSKAAREVDAHAACGLGGRPTCWLNNFPQRQRHHGYPCTPQPAPMCLRLLNNWGNHPDSNA